MCQFAFKGSKQLVFGSFDTVTADLFQHGKLCSFNILHFGLQFFNCGGLVLKDLFFFLKIIGSLVQIFFPLHQAILLTFDLAATLSELFFLLGAFFV